MPGRNSHESSKAWDHCYSAWYWRGVYAAAQVRAGGDKVAFPENYAKGVMYYSFDRPDVKQYRETFVTPAAIDALKNGQAVPSGTVITTVLHKAQLDRAGNPVKDANGRFVKGDLVGYAVMEKRTGWGAEYPEEKRNGEWEYQVFTPDRKVNEKANLNSCFECHKPHASTDFLFTADKIKAASK
jgi:Cytochrome P460